jgi:micrococcal nuclease
MLLIAASLAMCSITDGDTIRCGAERIRLADIDAPELSEPKCPSERALATRARDRLAELLGGEFQIHRTGTDRYKRTLARITVDGVDVGSILVREQLARPWEGRRRGWC